VGLAFGGLHAFNSGMLRDIMHSTILRAGRYRRGRVTALNQSLRRWSEDDGWTGLSQALKDAIKGNLNSAKTNMNRFIETMGRARNYAEDGLIEHQRRMERIMNSQLVDKEYEAFRLHSNYNEILRQMREQGIDEGSRAYRFAAERMRDFRVKYTTLDDKWEALQMHRTGFRHATINDLIRAGELSLDEPWVKEGMELFRQATGKAENFLTSRADRNILIDMDGNIADLRDFRKTFVGFIESITTDFTIPLIKINPLRMFYLDLFFRTEDKPFFYLAKPSHRNPIVTGHNGAANTPLFFVDGKVYDMLPADSDLPKQVAQGVFLADARRGPVARLLRNMSGISISKFNRPEANAPFWVRARYNLQSFLGLGQQDEPGGKFDFFDMTSWGQSFMNFFTKRLQMTKYQVRDDYLSDAFGEGAQYIFFHKPKSWNEYDNIKDFLGQLTAGRKDLTKVTVASLFPYGFVERLNATLNQVYLGLPNSDLGSAFDIFKNLMLKRIMPIWAGYELFQYVNYESENFTGEQFSDRFAKMYAHTSVEIARLRDKLGITEWAKGVSPLLVGGEQITEFPVIGRFFDWNDSEEETKEYWESGMDPVRKGRWWPLGNTPYTGGKIDYFQPNWVRRVLADAKFSDTMYGSRDEYFAHSWMPTPRYPLAPIRHFFTDPYHWEEKHYYDRPYPVTGGIPELEEFPLIGPVLNSTVGAILKPQRRMHMEYWEGQPEDLQEAVPVASFAPVTPELQRDFVMGTGMFGAAGGGTGPTVSIPASTMQAVQPVMAAYVTASGQVQLISTDDQENIQYARQIMQDRSPLYTGRFRQENLPQPGDVPDDSIPVFPGALSQVVGNLHYNVSEMGGFYGFMGTSVTGELFDDRPVLQSSSEISSYTRAFWDMDIGGYGGDANEIFRRFLPKERRLNEVNPIRNRMPDWLPGQDYFIDFQRGDPYVKIKKGEIRLPGEAYERMYNIDTDKMLRMEIGASFIGYDPQTIREHMLYMDAVKEESFKRKLDFGTDWHKAWEKQMAESGIAISMEGYVKDERAGISGFYDLYGDHEKILDYLFANAAEFTYFGPTYVPDPSGQGLQPDENLGGFYYEGSVIDLTDEESREQFKEFALTQGQYALIDPKTRSPWEWENGTVHFENIQQVNFYAQHMQTPINYLIHVDRENPDRGFKVYAFGANPELYDYSVAKVEAVREGIRQDIESGRLSRGDLYRPIDRYRILADVAPYSQEFRNLKSQLAMMDLTEEEQEEIRRINEMVSQRKQRLRLYPYRFTTANLENAFVTVDQVIDSNTFTTLEFPDNPIRLAGLRVPVGQDDPVAQQAREVIDSVIKPGKRLRIAIDADELNRVKDDTYQTIQAVVYDRKDRNLNYYLIQQGLAKEKEEDYSPAAVHARFTPREIAFGSLWERFAHMDTIIHTKFLQVRSPLESYERREVYGKDWQEWTDPIADYLIPAIQNAMVHHPIFAIAGGAFIGAAFGSLKSGDIGYTGERIVARYGKIVGGVLGASVMGTAVMYRMLYEEINNEAWIPKRRRKERETEEYFDILKYIKYNKLFEEYAKAAKEQEGFDVKAYIEQESREGQLREQRVKDLEDIKRLIYRSRQNQWPEIQERLRELGIDAEDRESAMKEINRELAALKQHREIRPVTPLAARAILYHQAASKTMYGYKPGDPVANVLAALPKKERDYLVPFIEAPEEERQRILDVVPSYVRRVLQSAWGLPVDEKISLQKYFESHPLPGPGWEGWRENVSIDDIKVKFVDRVGLDPSEFDIWPQDKQRAEMVDAPVPNVFGGWETASSYAEKIRGILQGAGLDEIEVDIVESNREGIQVDMDIRKDRREEFKRLVNTQGQYVI